LAPHSGGALKGHSRDQKWYLIFGTRPTWLSSRVAVALVFVAFSMVYIFIFAIHHHDQLEDGEIMGVARIQEAAYSLSEASLEIVRQSASKIHDQSFKELLYKLHHEKEAYRHLLKPKKSLFKKFDKNKPNAAIQDIVKKDKQGNVVYKPITSISIDDLGKLGIKGGSAAAKGVTYEQAIQGREHMIEKIHEAGIEEIDVASILSLPMWSTVTKLYGDIPIILGLERCHEFQTDHFRFPLWDASVGTAGLFNTGTNPFAMYLEQNCKLPYNKSNRAGGTR
jgi:hypothetical protein